MLESKLWQNKKETKNINVAKIMEFIETCDHYTRKFFQVHAWSSPLFAGENRFKKKRCSGEIGDFFLSGLAMIRNWGRGGGLRGNMTKNEQIQFFDSQMYFPVTLTPWIWNFSAAVLGYTGLRINSRNILEK